MTEIAVLTGQIVRAAPRSVREVDPRQWDGEAAWEAAVEFWLSAQRAQLTKDAYRRDIRMWHDWCAANDVPLDDARRADADAWRNQLAGSAATIARRMSAVSSFYLYWLDEDLVRRNPVARSKRPKVSSEPASISLTRHQAADLLAHIDQAGEQRAAVIVMLLAQTGMRVGELTRMLASDAGMTGGRYVVTITRKGGGRQTLPVAEKTWERIAAYLDGRTDGYLLFVKPGPRREGDGQMDRAYVRKLLRRLAREAGLPEVVWTRMHPHVLRHSAATLLAADGVPVHEIQKLLGHAVITTTQRYIHHDEDLDNSPVYRLSGLLAR